MTVVPGLDGSDQGNRSKSRIWGSGRELRNTQWKTKIQCQRGTEVQCCGRTKVWCWVWREKKQDWRNSTDRSISMISLSWVFGSKMIGFRGKRIQEKSRARAPLERDLLESWPEQGKGRTLTHWESKRTSVKFPWEKIGQKKALYPENRSKVSVPHQIRLRDIMFIVLLDETGIYRVPRACMEIGPSERTMGLAIMWWDCYVCSPHPFGVCCLEMSCHRREAAVSSLIAVRRERQNESECVCSYQESYTEQRLSIWESKGCGWLGLSLQVSPK